MSLHHCPSSLLSPKVFWPVEGASVDYISSSLCSALCALLCVQGMPLLL